MLPIRVPSLCAASTCLHLSHPTAPAWQINGFVGVIYICTAVAWALESLWSLWTLKTIYQDFRGRGGGAAVQKVRRGCAVPACTCIRRPVLAFPLLQVDAAGPALPAACAVSASLYPGRQTHAHV